MQEVNVSLASANDVSLDAAVAPDLSELGSIVMLIEE